MKIFIYLQVAAVSKKQLGIVGNNPRRALFANTPIAQSLYETMGINFPSSYFKTGAGMKSALLQAACNVKKGCISL